MSNKPPLADRWKALFDLPLTKSGLIVIAIPVVVQLCVFFWLSCLLHLNEVQEEREYRLKTVIGETNWLSALTAAGTFAWYLNCLTDDAQAGNLYRFCRDSLTADFKTLKEAVGSQPGEQEKLHLAEKCASEMFLSLAALGGSRAASQAQAADRDFALKSLAIIDPSWKKLLQLRHEFLFADKTRETFGPAVLRNVKLSESAAIDVLMLLNIAAALGLYYFYSQGITGRLKILAENAVRMAKREPLHDRLYGGDEVVLVDSAFHDMQKALADAERTKAQYVSMISHDLRTPLTAMMTTFELIERGSYGQLTEKGNNLLLQCSANVEMILLLINQLLEIDRLETGSLSLDCRTLAVAEVMERACSTVEALAESKKVRLKAIKSDLHVNADEGRLTEVLVNLLGNALKFSPPGSEITVSACQVDESVKLTVSDQGPGIPAEFREKIFDRFQQVSREDATVRGGSGLGLAICKAIVEAHGGSIGVDSESGKGSTFWLTLASDSHVERQ
ncbi:MAG TPA: HAMP domain-containing sensor histidine kinase [Chroococcales cyanobacterium]